MVATCVPFSLFYLLVAHLLPGSCMFVCFRRLIFCPNLKPYNIDMLWLPAQKYVIVQFYLDCVYSEETVCNQVFVWSWNCRSGYTTHLVGYTPDETRGTCPVQDSPQTETLPARQVMYCTIPSSCVLSVSGASHLHSSRFCCNAGPGVSCWDDGQ